MRTMFSTDGIVERKKFSRWCEIIHDRLVPVDQTQIDDEPFRGIVEAADVGVLAISRVTQTALRTEATAATIRRHAKHDTLSVVIKLEGVSSVEQDGRQAVQRPGDIVVIERRPTVMQSSSGSCSYLLEVPRQRLEGILGPSRLYTAKTVDAALPGATLVRTFIGELARVCETLTPDMSERMASIGIDLIVASLAESMARETPKMAQGDIIVQRAKAHIESRFTDPALDPAAVAAGIGVSLRRLQELFQEREHCVSEWIWERRLDSAAKRLRDPASAHVPIGTLAYDCGFSDQAHFSRRFRARYDHSPSEFRRERLVGSAGAN